jgi:anti-sigma factor RsiW
MKDCWTTGDLRAYVDRELAPEETALLEAHLGSCGACAERLGRISARAERVSGLLGSLAAEPLRSRGRKGAARGVWGRAAALALAASLALVFLSPKPAPPPKTAETARPFIALDNEPIETGMVVRVAFGPDQVLADVIITPDGRPRAYRLVDYTSNEGVKTE